MEGFAHVSLVAYAAMRGYKHGTVKRWVHEGMPVARDRFGKTVGVLPLDADQWVGERAKSGRFANAKTRDSLVYFARRASDGLIKIGFTSDWEQRANDFRKKRGGGEPVVLLGTMPGDKVTELAVQGRFSMYRVRTEWFTAAPELLAFIKKNARAA